MLNRAVSLFKRVRGNEQPTKNIGLSSYGNLDYYPLGFVGANNDLPYSKVGAGGCYHFVPEVHNCISSITGAIENLPWDIKRYPDGIRRRNRQAVDGEVLASDDDLITRHPFQRALQRFQRDNNFSLLGTIALDYNLYGEVALEIAKNDFGRNPTIEWLNPLGLQVFATYRIEWLRYGWNNNSVKYTPNEIAYLHNRNAFNDFIGYPQVLACLDKANIVRNADRFLIDYYSNNARPTLVVMPDKETHTMSPIDHANVKREMRNSLKGVGNQYRTWVLQQTMELLPLEQPDLAKNDTITQHQVDAIYEKFGVPRAMRGNSANSPYANGEETTKRFYWDAVLPLARIIQNFINAEIMPYYDETNGNEVFEFDTSQFDTTTETDMLEAQVIDMNTRGMLMDLYTGARKQEIDAHPKLKDMYIVEGIPVHIDDMREYWKTKLLVAPSVYNTPLLTGEPLPEPTSPDEVIPSDTGDGEPVSEEHIDEAIDNGASGNKSVCTCDGLECSCGNGLQSWQHALYEDDADENDIDERITASLKSWSKYALRRFDPVKSVDIHTPDVAQKLPPYIRFAVIDVLDTCASHDEIKTAFNNVLDTPHIKSIRTYVRALREFALALWRGDMTPSEFRVGVSKRISDSFDEAFMNGVKQGGLSRDDLNGNELNELTQAIEQEQTHVANLADWIEANSKADGGRQRDVFARVDRWGARYASIEDLGQLVASRDKPMLWEYDPRKEHCKSCKALHGQVRRASTWKKLNIRPKSARLECFGMYCGCTLSKTDKPIAKGRMPRIYLRD